MDALSIQFFLVAACRAMNIHPERVRDELFRSNDFFDANDMVQVKYEMLRRVEIEGWSVTKATEVFGFSRPSFYKTQKDFKLRGLVGLLAEKGGPKGGHKLSDEIMEFVEEYIQKNDLQSASKLAVIIKEQFNMQVHPRSIERALLRRKKKKEAK